MFYVHNSNGALSRLPVCPWVAQVEGRWPYHWPLRVQMTKPLSCSLNKSARLNRRLAQTQEPCRLRRGLGSVAPLLAPAKGACADPGTP